MAFNKVPRKVADGGPPPSGFDPGISDRDSTNTGCRAKVEPSIIGIAAKSTISILCMNENIKSVVPGIPPYWRGIFMPMKPIS
jgi:hypothetical protein